MRKLRYLLLAMVLLSGLTTAVVAEGPQLLTDLPSGLRTDPVWSPAQDYLALVALDGVYLVRRQDGNIRLIESLQNVDVTSSASFTADARYLSYSINGVLRTRRVADGAEVASPIQATGINFPLYSPDGRWFAYTVSSPLKNTVEVKDLRSGDVRIIGELGGRDLRYGLDGRMLYFLETGDKKIMRFDLEAGQRAVLHFDIGWFPSVGTRLVQWDVSSSGQIVGFLAQTPNRLTYCLYTWEVGGFLRLHTDNIKDLDMTRDGEIAYLSYNWYLERMDLVFDTRERIDGASVKQLQYSPQEDCLAYVKFLGLSNQLYLYTFIDPLPPTVPAVPVVVATGSDWLELEIPADGERYRYYINGVPGPVVAAGSGSVYRLEGLNSGQLYTLQISALCLGLESDPSEGVTAMTSHGVPAPPLALQPVDLAVTSFSVLIDDPQQNVGWQVRLDGGAPQWLTEPRVDFSGLAGARDYRVEVSTCRGGLCSAPLGLTVTTLEYPPFSPLVTLPVSDGTWYANPITLTATVSDPYLAGWSWFVDGQPFVDGSQFTVEGLHQLILVVRGLGGTELSFSASFGLDLTPPQLEFVNCIDGDLVPYGFSPELVVRDLYPAGFELRLDGMLTPADEARLGVGEHEVAVRAWDLAGNQALASVRLTVLAELPLLETFVLDPATIFAGESSIVGQVAWKLPMMAGNLEIWFRGTPILTRPLSAGVGQDHISLPLPSLLPGTYQLEARVVDDEGRNSETRVAEFVVQEKSGAWEIRIEERHLDQILVCGDERLIALAAQLGRPLTVADNDAELAELARSGRYGIYLVAPSRLRVDTEVLLGLRALSGDLLIGFRDLLRQRSRGKDKAVAGPVGEGYRALVNLQDVKAVREAIAAWESLPLPSNRIPRSKRFRVTLNCDGQDQAGNLRLEMQNAFVTTGADEVLESPADQLVPAGGMDIYLERQNDELLAEVLLSGSNGCGQATITVAALPSLADEALRLIADLSLMDLRRKGSLGVWKNLDRTVRRLLSIPLTNRLGRMRALILLGLADTLLGVIEKLEGRDYPEIRLDLLVLALRWGRGEMTDASKGKGKGKNR